MANQIIEYGKVGRCLQRAYFELYFLFMTPPHNLPEITTKIPKQTLSESLYH